MKFSLEQQLWEMLSREIFVNALAFTKRPILETIPGLGIGFKLCPWRSSHFPELLRKTASTRHPTKRTIAKFLRQTEKPFLFVNNCTKMEM